MSNCKSKILAEALVRLEGLAGALRLCFEASKNSPRQILRSGRPGLILTVTVNEPLETPLATIKNAGEYLAAPWHCINCGWMKDEQIMRLSILNRDVHLCRLCQKPVTDEPFFCNTCGILARAQVTESEGIFHCCLCGQEASHEPF